MSSWMLLPSSWIMFAFWSRVSWTLDEMFALWGVAVFTSVAPFSYSCSSVASFLFKLTCKTRRICIRYFSLNFSIRDQLHGQVLMFTVGESCFASLSAKRKTFAIIILTIGCCLGDYQSKIDRDKISLLRFIHSFICCEFTNLLLQTHYA